MGSADDPQGTGGDRPVGGNAGGDNRREGTVVVDVCDRLSHLVEATGLTPAEIVDAGIGLAHQLVHDGEMLNSEEIWIENVSEFFDRYRDKV